MVLVDTSVWIDFLTGRREANIVDSLLESEEALAYTGSILQELMQGCSGEGDAFSIEKHFSPFIEIFPQRSTYRLAAKIYRDCRNSGFIIRSSADCLIAACAIEHGCPVLHRDRDFSFIEKVFHLKTHKR